MKSALARFAAPYLAFLRLPDVTAMVISAWLSRMPIAMTGFSMLMFVRAALGDFKLAGSVVGAYFITMAVAAPIQGRLIDRIGPMRPLKITGWLQPVFLIMLFTAAEMKLPLPVIMACAVLAGAFTAPITVLARTIWRHRFLKDDERRMAYSIDSIMIELNFTLGPALVGLVIAFAEPRFAFAMAIAMTFISFLIFLRSPSLKYWKDEPHAERHLLGPLTDLKLVALFCLTFGMTFCFGILEVGYPAFATSLSIPALAGLLLAINSIGSAIGGAVYGGMHFRPSLERQFTIALALMAIPLFLHFWVDQVVLFTIVAFCAGLAIAPALTAQTLLVSRIAPAKYATEAFTWSSTFIVSGLGAGMAAGGAIAETYGVKMPFLVGGTVVACMAALALMLKASPVVEPTAAVT